MFRFPGTVRYVNECEKLEIHREGVKNFSLLEYESLFLIVSKESSKVARMIELEIS